MKRCVLASAILALSLVFNSCNSDQPCEFKTEELWDWFYIDVPNNLKFDRDYSIKNVMANYVEPDHNAVLAVFMKDSVNKTVLQEIVEGDKQMYEKRGCNVTNYMISDSVASFKYEKGLFMGKAHYIIKDVDGIFHFLVKYDGTEGRNLDVIKQVANSIQLRVVIPDTTVNYNPIYENKYFSVSYPKTWQYLEHPDAMSDIYIGLREEQFGVIIVRFEQDMKISDINKECVNQQRNLGLSVTNTKYKIAGKDGYKTVSKGVIGGMNVKFIEYSFKNGNMFFELKFGGDAKIADKYNKEMQDIVKSFTLK